MSRSNIGKLKMRLRRTERAYEKLRRRMLTIVQTGMFMERVIEAMRKEIAEKESVPAADVLP